MEKELNLFTHTNEVRHIDLPNHVSPVCFKLISFGRDDFTVVFIVECVNFIACNKSYALTNIT